jgi:bacterioferritin (cytochrome b1)
MRAWLNYFQHNRQNRLPVPWERGIEIEAQLRGPLIRSLQKFQLGESGEGRRLRRHAAATGDPVYAAAIVLFVREEQEHARLMGEVLRLLDAPLLQSDWTDHCFILLRHLFGLHQELMVLLLPEMIAKRYFRALHEGTRDPVLRAVTAQILQDEEGHVAFHVEYLRRAFESMSFTRRILAQVMWRMAFRATCLAVMIDHRAILRAVGVAPHEFWRDCGRIFDEAAAGIFSPAHVLAPIRLATGPGQVV